MNITIVAFETWDRSDAGEVIYHGTDGEKAQSTGLAAFAKGFVRVGKMVNPPLIPLHPPAVMATAKPVEAAKKKPVSDEPKPIQPKS